MLGTGRAWHGGKDGGTSRYMLPRMRLLLRFKTRRRGFFCCLESIIEFGTSLVTLSGVSYILLVACMCSQSIILNMYLARFLSSVANITYAVEIPLLLHIFWFWREESAARAVPTQWLVYSWVHATKVVVLFIIVMPRLSHNGVSSGLMVDVGLVRLTGWTLSDMFSPATLSNALLLTPLIYAVMIFRISVAIFGETSTKMTADMLTLFDLLWHVVIDMVDEVDIFYFASRISENLPQSIVDGRRKELTWIQACCVSVLFISIVLQCQALPGVVVDSWNIPKASSDVKVETSPPKLERVAGPERGDVSPQRTVVRITSENKSPNGEYDHKVKERQRKRSMHTILILIARQSIVIARKRSAIVSIFFVDLPFLLVRCFVWLNIGLAFPAFGVKNIICIVLNILQYTLVRLVATEMCSEVTRSIALYRLIFVADTKRTSPLMQTARANPNSSPLATPYLQPIDLQVSPFSKGFSIPTGLTRKDMLECERLARKQHVRGMSVCVYFWALMSALVAGVLLARGESFFNTLGALIQATTVKVGDAFAS